MAGKVLGLQGGCAGRRLVGRRRLGEACFVDTTLPALRYVVTIDTIFMDNVRRYYLGINQLRVDHLQFFLGAQGCHSLISELLFHFLEYTLEGLGFPGCTSDLLGKRL